MPDRTPVSRRTLHSWALLTALIVSGMGQCDPERNGTGYSSAVVTDLASGTDANLIGLSIVDQNVWWTSGASGTVARTVDGGTSWEVRVVPGADSLQFRDIHAFDSEQAFALSIGPGDQSRIYHTVDGGVTWSLQWQNDVAEEFYDCFDFWTTTHGIAMGDAAVDRLSVLVTEDGQSWSRVPPESVPLAHEDEGGFAASGTCLVAAGDSLAWIATGSPEGSRIYRTDNRGRDWTVTDLEFGKGYEAAGFMTLAFIDANHGFVAGGIIDEPDQSVRNLAETLDGGRTWSMLEGPELPNVYCLAVSPTGTMRRMLAVGPNGINSSADYGRSWRSIDDRNHWSVRFVTADVAVAVGTAGRVSLIDFRVDS